MNTNLPMYMLMFLAIVTECTEATPVWDQVEFTARQLAGSVEKRFLGYHNSAELSWSREKSEETTAEQSRPSIPKQWSQIFFHQK
jgi:hypothetical protein